MQRFAALALFILVGMTAASAQSGSAGPINQGTPAWQKGIGGPFPVQPQEASRPIGLWAQEGSECFSDRMVAIQIDRDTITLIDPTAHSGSFSTENGGSFEIVDLSRQTGSITKAEPKGMGHHFVAEMEDGEILDFVLQLFPDQKATMTFEDGFALNLTKCDKP